MAAHTHCGVGPPEQALVQAVERVDIGGRFGVAAVRRKAGNGDDDQQQAALLQAEKIVPDLIGRTA